MLGGARPKCVGPPYIMFGGIPGIPGNPGIPGIGNPGIMPGIMPGMSPGSRSNC